MKNKILSLVVLAALCITCLSGCSVNNSTGSGGESQSADNSAGSANRKYENLTADSSPVGVDEIKFSSDDGYTIISGRIYKNSSEIEEGAIAITFEMYDENGDYFADKTITTDLLTEGENERFEDDIIWEAEDANSKNVPDETLANYSVKISDIVETDKDEIELQNTISQVDNAVMLAYDSENIAKARILVDSALQKYPDNTDLKLLDAELKEKEAENASAE
ncbi:MAG TPA: hypothetical protein H9685_04595 [Firmicutes bacterium]|nr:hypothetical protein [Bacillota bacterium]